jgi:hypothetical protein
VGAPVLVGAPVRGALGGTAGGTGGTVVSGAVTGAAFVHGAGGDGTFVHASALHSSVGNGAFVHASVAHDAGDAGPVPGGASADVPVIDGGVAGGPHDAASPTGAPAAGRRPGRVRWAGTSGRVTSAWRPRPMRAMLRTDSLPSV